MNPSVSVIIPTYNRKKMLEESIRAVLGQTSKPAEVIVLDDGSTDGTAEFISKEFGSRVMVQRLDHSGLPAVARNRGIALASGEIIAFCDSDDVWFPDKLERQLEWMERESVDLCCSDALVYKSENERYLSRYHFRSSSLEECLARENYVITSSVLLRNDALGTDRFSEDLAYRGYEDYLLWLKLAVKCRVGYCPEPLLWYRIHKSSVSFSNKVRDSLIQMRIVFSGNIVFRHPTVGIMKLLRYLRAIVRSYIGRDR